MKYHDVKPGIFRKIAILGTVMFCMASVLTLFSKGAQGKGASGSIYASLEPRQIPLGGAAILNVNLSGVQAGRPDIPEVDGLRFTPAGQSSQYRSINGRAHSSVSYLYRVQAEHPGNFTIPPVKVVVDGHLKKTPPLTLRVLRANGPGAGSSSLPPPRGMANRRATRLGPDKRGQFAFLRVIPDKVRSYVGEMIPVEVKAFFKEGLQVSLDSLPVIRGKAFACHPMSKRPQQGQEVIDGHLFNVLTWYTAISGVKEGEYPLDVHLAATVLIPKPSRSGRSSFGRGSLRNSFLDSFFDRQLNDDLFEDLFNPVERRSVEMVSPVEKLRVFKLPEAGRPKNFSGAVGLFELSATASPRRTAVGDPITLKTTIRGRGNFDRVSPPLLSSRRGWKTYTPSSTFEPSDSAGYAGKKEFEQAIIPLDTSIQELPPVVFSYFDTKAHKYVSLRTRPLPVKVTGAPLRSTGLSVKASIPEPKNSSQEGNHLEGMAPIHVALGPIVSSLRPTLKEKWFLGAQSIPLGALFVGLFLGYRRRRMVHDSEASSRRELRHKINECFREMDRAVAEDNVPAFFGACRSAAQECLGKKWSVPAEAITLADVKERLSESSGGIREVFETADAVAYSGKSFTQEELRQWKELLIKELANLEETR